MQTTRSEKLDLRLTPEAKRTLNIAVSAAGRSVSEFVLESALSRAEETLAVREHFGLDAERWEAFMAALEAPHQHRIDLLSELALSSDELQAAMSVLRLLDRFWTDVA